MMKNMGQNMTQEGVPDMAQMMAMFSNLQPGS